MVLSFLWWGERREEGGGKRGQRGRGAEGQRGRGREDIQNLLSNELVSRLKLETSSLHQQLVNP
ncbi:MAG: hypothetical protein WBB28_24675 [Crinalium sp.]